MLETLQRLKTQVFPSNFHNRFRGHRTTPMNRHSTLYFDRIAILNSRFHGSGNQCSERHQRGCRYCDPEAGLAVSGRD